MTAIPFTDPGSSAKPFRWVPEAVFILCSLLLFFVLFYHRWPLFEDHGIFHYAAWGIAQGLVPYVDIVDVNWPGIYVIHYLARLISGSSPLGLRLVDSLHVAAACAVLSFVLGELGVGRPLRILCLTAYLMSYFFGGYNNTAQRESFGLGMLLLGCWPWVRIGRHRRPPSVIWFFLSGLLMASAVFIRPQVAPLGLVFVAWGFLPDWRNRSAWWPLVAYGAGGVLLCSLGVVWLDRLGSLRGFWDWSVAFALTEYKAWRLPLASMAGYLIRNVTTRGGGFSTLLLLAALGLLLRERDWRALLRSHIRVLALGGGTLVASVLIAWSQSKGVPYHCIPLQWALALSAGLLLSMTRTAGWLEYHGRTVIAVCGLTLGLFACTLHVIGMSPTLSARWRPWSFQPTDGTLMARRLTPFLAAGETAVLFDASAYTFWAELERPAPFPYIAGVCYWLLALGPDHQRCRIILDDLALALNRSSVRFFIVEMVSGSCPDQSDSPETMLRYNQAVPAIMESAFRERPDLSSERFKVFERHP